MLVQVEHVVETPGTCGGRPRIAGHRIRVQDISIWHTRMGMSAGRIAADFNLTLAEVHAALAYYFDHCSEINAMIEQDEKFAEEMKAKSPSMLEAKLRQLRGEN